jgi:UDP-glucose 4-epimerase
MKVLVTGGFGFVGWALTRCLLDAGHQVAMLTRGTAGCPPPGAVAITADLRDAPALVEAIRPGGYDGVCHLAALTRPRDSMADPLAYWDVNVAGTLNVLKAIAGPPGQPSPRVVFASTNIVYGSRSEGALSETLPPHPESPYAASKAAAERLLRDVAGTGAISATVLRVFNASGAVAGRPDRDTARLIPNILRVARGELPALSVNGDGGVRRDYTHVLDVAEAFRLALEDNRPGISTYNVGTGKGTSITELVAVAESVTGRDIPVQHLPPRAEPQTSVADPTRIMADLGWRPDHSSLTRILRDAWAAPA